MLNVGVRALVKSKVGCQLPQEIGDFKTLVKIAQDCEELGYDSIWAYDHLSPFWLRRPQGFECWTLLAAIAQRTKKIKLGTLVTNVNLRNPALLAKMASTVDNISGGRLMLGLGTGDKWSRGELKSYGYEFPGLEERVGRLRETILILKSMWTQPITTFNGQHYRLSNAVSFPKPIQKPSPPIWVGGKHRRILEVIAEFGDGWNYWDIKKGKAERLNRYLADRCMQLGRRPEEITKSWAGPLDSLFRRDESRRVIVEKIREKLRSETAHGTRYFIAAFGTTTKSWCYESFVEAARSLD